MVTSEEVRTLFLRTYTECADAIFRHCYLRIGHRELARDITQETFVRTWHYLQSGKTVDNMRAFCYKVATNLMLEEFRRKKESSLDALQEKGFEPSAQDSERLSNILDGKEAIATLGQLDEEYREVVIMRYIDELSPKEIAQILGVSENVVSVRIHRGIKKLRALLA